MVSPNSPLTLQRRTPLPKRQPHIPSETDVALEARNAERNRVRAKFEDVIQVSDRCHEFEKGDIENARDDYVMILNNDEIM